jgi:hypothetical protein
MAIDSRGDERPNDIVKNLSAIQIQTIGPCGDTDGSCLTMTLATNNPKGSFITATSCNDRNSLQSWTFDVVRGYICSRKMPTSCIHWNDGAEDNKYSRIPCASNKTKPETFHYNPATFALFSIDHIAIVDNGGGLDDPIYGNTAQTCNDPVGCQQWRFKNEEGRRTKDERRKYEAGRQSN